MKPIMPKRSPRVSAAATAQRSMPSTGLLVAMRTASSPGSLTQPMT